MVHSNFDYAYAAFGLIFGIVMMASPRTFMRGAKYDEESIKAESFVKKAGAGLAVLAIFFAVYVYFR